MRAVPRKQHKRKTEAPSARAWKLEDAKARFSELVRRANEEGPQSVTVRGKPAVVIVDAADYGRLTEGRRPLQLVAFLESLRLAEIDTTRETDTGRDLAL